VTVPTIVEVPDDTVTTCNVVAGGTTTAMACTYSSGLRAIKIVSDGSDVAAVTKGETVEIVLGTLTNPTTPFETAESFALTTYVSDAFADAYDEVSSGVEPAFQCDSPCKYCDSTDKEKCRKCFSEDDTTEYLYYYLDE
jgi:hypothetical protein